MKLNNIAFNLIAKGAIKKGSVEVPNLFPDLETNIFYRLSDFTAADFPTPITGLATTYNNGIVNMSASSEWTAFSRFAWKVIDNNGGLNFMGASNASFIWTPLSGTAWLNFEFLNAPVAISNVLLRPFGTSDTYQPIKFFLEGSNDGVNYELISEVYDKPTNPYGSVLLFTHYNINPTAKKFTHIRAGFDLGTLGNAGYQYIQDLYLYGTE